MKDVLHEHETEAPRRAPPAPSRTPSTSVEQVQHLGELAGNQAVATMFKREPNRTGLPDRLKSGIERLSGVALDDVRVHYSSPEPARYDALAFTRGSTIHVAPGQERHVAHEAWHTVQQKQGRVVANGRVGDAPLNDDSALEREADVMGRRALGS
ncbi:MAG: DUF4157 domain-containing protein [Actinomycetota bacterium]|nr:DUF4157 domain-containing protein [Actinomycetota bacterium]